MLFLQACQEGTDGSHYKLGDENSEVMYYNVDNDKSSVILYYSSPTNDDSLRYRVQYKWLLQKCSQSRPSALSVKKLRLITEEFEI